MRRLLIAALVLLSQAARAERAPLAVLWLGAPDERVQSAIDGALGGSRELRPLDDEAARRVLLDGGAGSRVAALVADGKARFASLTALDEADRRLAEAESVALRAMPIAEACPRLVEIETLRLRYAELQLDAGAAARAARILAACAPSPSPELAAAIARHPAPPAPAQPPARVESEPPGATVFLDLRPIGKTPIDLPPARRPDALLDVELPGFRKVHREAPSSGVLAVVLSRGEDLGALVDGARAEAERSGPDAAAAPAAAIGRAVGASRVLALRREPDGRTLWARAADPATSAWTNPPMALPLASFEGAAAAESGARLVGYASPSLSPPVVVTAAPTLAKPVKVTVATAATVAKPAAPAAPVPAWKRWYTWVAAGAVLAIVGGLLIADHYGSDQVTVHVSH